MNPDIVIEFRGFPGSPGNCSPSHHPHQQRLLPCSHASILQEKQLAPRGDLRFHNQLWFSSQWTSALPSPTTVLLLLNRLSYVASDHVKEDISVYILTCYHYLLTDFQHDRRCIFSGTRMFCFLHTFRRGWLGGIRGNSHRSRNQSLETEPSLRSEHHKLTAM